MKIVKEAMNDIKGFPLGQLKQIAKDYGVELSTVQQAANNAGGDPSKLYSDLDKFKVNKKESGSKTAKCPDCGGKYLKQTGYCLACKKKVGEKKKESFIKEAKVKARHVIKGRTYKTDEEDSVTILSKKKDSAGQYEITVKLSNGKTDEWYLEPDEEIFEIKEDSEIITIPESARIPGTDYILEKGDRIKIVTEEKLTTTSKDKKAVKAAIDIVDGDVDYSLEVASDGYIVVNVNGKTNVDRVKAGIANADSVSLKK